MEIDMDKIILVITEESGFKEENLQPHPNKDVETLVTKDYKKGVQKTETFIKCTPVRIEELRTDNTKEIE